MARQRCLGSPILHDEVTNDLVGVKDPDGSEFYWQRVPRVGSFFDTTDQVAVANTATAMTFNTTDVSVGVTVESGSRITVNRGGLFNFQFSAQFVSSSLQIEDVSIWFRRNGVDIADSNSLVSVHSSHGGVDGQVIAAWNLYVRLVANDYVEIIWSTPNVAVVLADIPPQSSPTRPGTPSIILTVNEVMA